jgi:hypothetical protein
LSKISVFLSWSGESSHKVAAALRDWLPIVQQSIEPFMSSRDIAKGARWNAEIAQKLEICGFGILCLTPDNLVAPWVLFEAGALSKMVQAASVVPLLTGGMKKSDISFPLAQFQAALPIKEEIYGVVQAINTKLAGEGLEEARLKRAFELAWPELETALTAIEADIKAAAAKAPDKPPAPDITTVAAKLDELVELARTSNRILRNPEQLLPPEYIQLVTSSPFAMGGAGGPLFRRYTAPRKPPPRYPEEPDTSASNTQVGGPSDPNAE